MHCPKVAFCPSSSFPAFLDVRDTTLGRNITTRFAGVCQFSSQRLAHRYRNFRSATRFQQHRFCACVKRTCFSHFREGSHTRASFQMRSMGIYGIFVFSASNGRSFSQESPLGYFRTDGRASANSRRTENGTPKFRKGYGRAAAKAG